MRFSINRPPRRFTPVDLLRQHPLASGLILATFPGNGGVNLVRGNIPIAYPGYSTLATPYGSSGVFASGAVNGLNYGNYATGAAFGFGSTGAYSIVAIAAPAPTAIRITSPFSYTAPLDGPRMWMNADASPNFVSSKFCLLDYNSTTGGGTVGGATSTSGAIDGAWHVFGGSRPGAGATSSVYLDGVDVTASTSGIGNAIASNSTAFVGGNIFDDKGADYPMLFVAVWNRGLFAAEHMALAINPWQILRPAKVTPQWQGFAGAFHARPYYDMIGTG